MSRPDRTCRPGTLARRLSATAVVVLALAGGGDSVVRRGAAAVIGSTRISTERLAEDVQTGLSDPAAAEQLGSDRPAYQRSVLSRLINAQVVEEAARRRGISVTRGDIDQQYTAIEQSVGGPDQLKTQAAAAGLTLDQVRDLARTRALTTALGDRLTEGVTVPEAQLRQAYQQGIDTFDQVRTAQILLPSVAAARELLPQARGLDDDAFRRLATERSTDEASKAAGGDLGFVPRGAFAQNGLEAYGEAAFEAGVGDTFVVSSSRGGHVVRVLERRTTTFEQASPQLRRTVLQEQTGPLVEEELRRTEADLGVTINPRFGRWDGSQLQVVDRVAEGNAQVSSPGPPAGGPAVDLPLDGTTPDGTTPEGTPPDGTTPEGTPPDGAAPQ